MHKKYTETCVLRLRNLTTSTHIVLRTILSQTHQRRLLKLIHCATYPMTELLPHTEMNIYKYETPMPHPSYKSLLFLKSYRHLHTVQLCKDHTMIFVQKIEITRRFRNYNESALLPNSQVTSLLMGMNRYFGIKVLCA